MDFEHQSRLEAHVLEFIELSTQMARGREEVLEKLTYAETQLKDFSHEIERMKREKLDERQALAAKERKVQEDRSALVLEIERLKAMNEEHEARNHALRAQNEQLQLAVHAQSQNASSSSASQSFSSSAGGSTSSSSNRLSHLMAKEVIDQITSLHEYVKSLESRTSVVATQAAQADTRLMDANKLVEAAHEALTKYKAQLEHVRAAHVAAVAKSRTDAMTISALTLDVQGLQEQINRLREDLALLHHTRRNLEAELERTKLQIATSLLPILEQKQQEQVAVIITATTTKRIAVESAETPATLVRASENHPTLDVALQCNATNGAQTQQQGPMDHRSGSHFIKQDLPTRCEKAKIEDHEPQRQLLDQIRGLGQSQNGSHCHSSESGNTQEHALEPNTPSPFPATSAESFALITAPSGFEANLHGDQVIELTSN